MLAYCSSEPLSKPPYDLQLFLTQSPEPHQTESRVIAKQCETSLEPPTHYLSSHQSAVDLTATSLGALEQADHGLPHSLADVHVRDGIAAIVITRVRSL